MKILKWILVVIVGLALLGFMALASSLYIKHYPLPWDTPDVLSGKTDTIEVWDVQWACDCAEWRVIGEEFPEDELAMRCIFIEAAPGVIEYDEIKLPDGCWPHQLRLVGQFYTDKGISRDYDFIAEKPEYARVFRYDSYTVTDKRCPFDYASEE